MFIRIKHDDNLDLINTDNILYITRNKHVDNNNIRIILKENKLIVLNGDYEKFLDSFQRIIENYKKSICTTIDVDNL